jgi:hypothetical protein
MMTYLHYLLIPFTALCCGIGYRIRGGLWNTTIKLPGQMARLLGWGVPCGVTAYLAGCHWLPALLIVPMMWAGSIISLFSAIDLGKNEGNFITDFTLLTLRGLLAVLGSVAVLWYFGYSHYWILAIAGLMMGLVYLIADKLNFHIDGFGSGGFPEVGEFLFGITVGLGIWFAVAPYNF